MLMNQLKNKYNYRLTNGVSCKKRRNKMTEYEKNKIIGIINGMSDEEREVVIFALNEIYGGCRK